MGDFFKMPNDQSSIAEADDIVRLMAENDRAVEDAINKIGQRSGSTGGDTVVLTSTAPGSVSVEAPTDSQFYLAVSKINLSGPALQEVYCTSSAGGGLAASSRALATIPSGKTGGGADMVHVAAATSTVLVTVEAVSYTSDVTVDVTVVFVPFKLSL